MERVTIFDTTLRDGEQSPGATMNDLEKMEVAQALAALGVDVIEAGFPVASPGDFKSVQAIARQVQGPIICGLARAAAPDIQAVADAVADAPRKRIHLFLATSPIHREHKLRMSREQVVARAVEGVSRARALCEDVEFSAEDASRTEPEFLAEVLEKVLEAGATTLNIPDTVGYTLPQAYGALVGYLKQHVRGVERAVLSVHCHNDLGLAVGNTLSALEAGARQVECTINGIGERAGNCALEEVVMALRTHSEHFKLETGIHTRRLYPTSRLLASVTGLQVQRNKAIVGENAFAHESGIHQHGMLQNRATYEIMLPEDVGVPRTQLVLGKHSGRHAFRARVEDLGFKLDEARLQQAFDAFKALADKKKEVYDADLTSLLGQSVSGVAGEWHMVSASTSGGAGGTPVAAVCLRGPDGTEVREAATGSGPIDAVFNAVVRITGAQAKLCDYSVRSITMGAEAQGEALVQVEVDGRAYRGRGNSTDILEASARAVIHAINRVLVEHKPEPRMAANV